MTPYRRMLYQHLSYSVAFWPLLPFIIYQADKDIHFLAAVSSYFAAFVFLCSVAACYFYYGSIKAYTKGKRREQDLAVLVLYGGFLLASLITLLLGAYEQA